jgi:hypothetical protein
MLNIKDTIVSDSVSPDLFKLLTRSVVLRDKFTKNLVKNNIEHILLKLQNENTSEINSFFVFGLFLFFGCKIY